MPSLTRSRVLCVDDDEDACEMLKALMNSYGIDATCARSAVDAWPLINAEHFDLFMLDAWLPRLDGFAFCRQIRAFDSNTPILFYSGAAYDADKQNGISAGANAYVTKPDLECLIETTVDLIAKAKAHAANVRRVSDRCLPAAHSLSRIASTSRAWVLASSLAAKLLVRDGSNPTLDSVTLGH